MQHNKSFIIMAGAAVTLLAGCSATRITEPPRTAVEQLLLSTAIDRSLEGVDFSSFNGQTVFFDNKLFEGYDSKYALGAIRDAMSRQGALLVDSADKARFIVEPRSGAIGIDSHNELLGIPDLTLPIPLAGAVETPEVTLWKVDKADSTVKVAVLAFDKETGQHRYSSGSLVGKSFNHQYKVLGIFNWRNTDIPERQSKVMGRNINRISTEEAEE
jgi:hypothetical protein